MKKSLKTKLRIRFVLLAMVSLLLIQSVITGVSIYHNYQDLVTKSDMLLSQLHKNPNGANRYFSVKIPTGKDTVYIDAVQHVSITKDEAAAFAQRARISGEDRGFVDGYRYHIYRNEHGTRIYFLNRESGMEMYSAAAENMVAVSLIGIVAIGILLIPVSGWVVKPMVDNDNRQKQFITSAGHELKTPLTVISTNAQLLESEIGKNDWLDGIQRQTAHLTQMTHELVALSKAEELEKRPVRELFSISDALREVAEAYEVVIKQKGLQSVCRIPENMEYSGSKAEIQQLFRILLDNACKYATGDGMISMEAKRIFRGIEICVVNTAEFTSNEDQELLQRFHRGENAVGKAGFGLGLSIARAIARRHNGHIEVSASEGTFRVEVILR